MTKTSGRAELHTRHGRHTLRRIAKLTAALAAGVLAVVMWSGCADSLFYRPGGKPGSFRHLGPNAREVWFRSQGEDVQKLHGVWLRAEGEHLGTVVYCHGNNGNVATQMRNVTWLPKRGFDVLIFDYRGYGNSTGEPDRAGTVADALAAIDLALARDPDRTAVFGHSLGGAIGIVAAAQRPAVRSVIAESTFASYREIAADRAGLFFWLVPLLISEGMDPDDFLDKLPPRPLLVIHGARDRIVPLEHGEALFERAFAPKRFHLALNSGHATPWRQEGRPFEELVTRHILDSLSPQATAPLRDR